VKLALVSLICGLVFGAGLALSGMTDPGKVTGFLDFTGRWDPSLALVMMGALGVHLIAVRVARARAAPLLDRAFHLPDHTRVDARLLVGSALFGVGWALTGMCPGPALVSLGAAAQGPLLFVATMALGAVAGRKLEERLARRTNDGDSGAFTVPHAEDA
jgi:uncharacterized membrane protein YedE/YeeE